MKILRYRGRHYDIYFDVSTGEKEQRTYLALFNYLDTVCGYYRQVYGDENLALGGGRSGDWKDAKWMLQLRREYEYEKWDIIYCVTDEQMDAW